MTRRTRFTTSSIIDLDSVSCSTDPEEAIGFAEKGTIIKLSSSNPFLDLVRSRSDLKFLRKEGEVLYFVKQ